MMVLNEMPLLLTIKEAADYLKLSYSTVFQNRIRWGFFTMPGTRSWRISYDDLTQEGIIGLIKAHELFEDDKDFKLYKDYYIARAMFNYIESYANYRKTAFREYAEYEIHKENHPKISLKDKSKSEELKKLEKENKEKHIEEMKQLEKRAEYQFDYLNLKYRLGEREIEAISLYFGLDGHKRKNFSEIQSIMKIDNDTLDKIVKDALFKLSVVDEKVEL